MSEKIRFWYPDRQYAAHKEEFDQAWEDTVSKGNLILREDVEEFEQKLAEFLNVKEVVSVASGTDALILSLKACRIRQGDEVLVPSYTFRATVEAVHHVGAKPVLYDLDGDYEHLLTKKTAAIIPCHLEGQVWDDMKALTEFAKKHGFIVIEDAAQAIGTSVQGSTACYSFYPAKILGCFGDGGAIATNSKSLAEHLRKMRNHYKGDWGAGYGYNSRLDNLQAALLNVKLKYLPENLARRRKIARRYDKELVGVGKPVEREIYQDYVITTPKRDDLHRFLEEKGIETMKNEYPFPSDLTKGAMTRSYEAYSLRIPCTPEHTDEEIGRVIEAINSYAG